MRGYVTINEVGNIIQKRFETEREIENDEKERKEKFVKKYGGNKTRWPKEVQEKFEYGEELD